MIRAAVEFAVGLVLFFTWLGCEAAGLAVRLVQRAGEPA